MKTKIFIDYEKRLPAMQVFARLLHVPMKKGEQQTANNTTSFNFDYSCDDRVGHSYTIPHITAEAISVLILQDIPDAQVSEIP